jgi:hypothetical protein
MPEDIESRSKQIEPTSLFLPYPMGVVSLTATAILESALEVRLQALCACVQELGV